MLCHSASACPSDLQAGKKPFTTLVSASAFTWGFAHLLVHPSRLQWPNWGTGALRDTMSKGHAEAEGNTIPCSPLTHKGRQVTEAGLALGKSMPMVLGPALLGQAVPGLCRSLGCHRSMSSRWGRSSPWFVTDLIALFRWVDRASQACCRGRRGRHGRPKSRVD